MKTKEPTVRVRINRFLHNNAGDWFTAEAVSSLLMLNHGYVSRQLHKLVKDHKSKIYRRKHTRDNKVFRDVFSWQAGKVG